MQLNNKDSLEHIINTVLENNIIINDVESNTISSRLILLMRYYVSRKTSKHSYYSIYIEKCYEDLLTLDIHNLINQYKDMSIIFTDEPITKYYIDNGGSFIDNKNKVILLKNEEISILGMF